ncbi:MAG TPA: hypothetical protein VIE36_24420 [Methylomirabilota bacterium]|jgi:hypothetical protein
MSAEQERSLEGWDPGLVDGPDLAFVVERAFDYRGDVTVVHRDGRELVGYLFNRDAGARPPFVQMLARDGGDAVVIPYADIATIRFTGRDTAAGNSYAAWLRSRDAAKASKPASSA